LVFIIPVLLVTFMKVRHKFVSSSREIKRLEAISRYYSYYYHHYYHIIIIIKSLI
jgi:hypothetical protein